MCPGKDSTRAERQKKPRLISVFQSDTFVVVKYPPQEASRELGKELCFFKISQRRKNIIS